MISTIYQRNLEHIFQKEKNITMERLKELFVDTEMMNNTTLYRILDRWKAHGKIFEIQVDKKRIFLYCHHAHHNSGTLISYCKNCQKVSESHFPLPNNTEYAKNVEFLKYCKNCQ